MMVFDDIYAERLAQIDKWGGIPHDDLHGNRDWVGFIHAHAERACEGDSFRNQMIRVAALAVAAIESFDRRGMPPDQSQQWRDALAQLHSSVDQAMGDSDLPNDDGDLMQAMQFAADALGTNR